MTTSHATSTLTDPADPARTASAPAHLDTHDPAPLDQRIFEAAVASLRTLSIHLGHRPGLYRGVSAPDGVTADDLATIARIAPRYAIEWLKQQGVAGL